MEGQETRISNRFQWGKSCCHCAAVSYHCTAPARESTARGPKQQERSCQSDRLQPSSNPNLKEPKGPHNPKEPKEFLRFGPVVACLSVGSDRQGPGSDTTKSVILAVDNWSLDNSYSDVQGRLDSYIEPCPGHFTTRPFLSSEPIKQPTDRSRAAVANIDQLFAQRTLGLRIGVAEARLTLQAERPAPHA